MIVRWRSSQPGRPLPQLCRSDPKCAADLLHVARRGQGPVQGQGLRQTPPFIALLVKFFRVLQEQPVSAFEDFSGQRTFDRHFTVRRFRHVMAHQKNSFWDYPRIPRYSPRLDVPDGIGHAAVSDTLPDSPPAWYGSTLRRYWRRTAGPGSRSRCTGLPRARFPG